MLIHQIQLVLLLLNTVLLHSFNLVMSGEDLLTPSHLYQGTSFRDFPPTIDDGLEDVNAVVHDQHAQSSVHTTPMGLEFGEFKLITA